MPKRTWRPRPRPSSCLGPAKGQTARQGSCPTQRREPLIAAAPAVLRLTWTWCRPLAPQLTRITDVARPQAAAAPHALSQREVTVRGRQPAGGGGRWAGAAPARGRHGSRAFQQGRGGIQAASIALQPLASSRALRVACVCVWVGGGSVWGAGHGCGSRPWVRVPVSQRRRWHAWRRTLVNTPRLSE